MLDKRSKPDAIDLSHHLSILSRNRALSPLKGLQKYFGKPGILSLAGGLPSPEYFPFESVGADILSTNWQTSTSKTPFSWFWDFFPSKASNIRISVPKYPENPGDVNLATALQYGLAKGIPQLIDIIKELTTKVYQPAYANFVTLLHAGNTDGWQKIVTTLCNPGEGVLCCEWTYPSALASMMPHGIHSVPVKMDGQGMSSTCLLEILSRWDEEAREMPRPHVMYIVPIGQNPTGATMGAARKKDIYDICVKFDVIIVEDDPYYFLQEGPYQHPSRRSSRTLPTEMADEQYIASLAPSFLKFDYQGRVVRLDTFSKVIAPGSRLGWFTCNPIFAERLERQAETSTQGPCGFGQSLIAQTLLTWQYKGYLQWLKGLGLQYKKRRDFFIDCLTEKFELELAPASNGSFDENSVYIASEIKRGSRNEKADTRVLFSFVPPTSGMFVWLQLHFDGHPQLKVLGQETLEMKLWTALAEGGLLIGPGSMFSANRTISETSRAGHFRLSFSNASYNDLKKAADIFERVLKEFHKI